MTEEKKTSSIQRAREKKEDRPEGVRLKPVLAIPIERNIHQLAFYSLLNVARYRNYQMLQVGYGRTDFIRNKYVKLFLEETDGTHLVMLDNDHIHPVDIVDQLMKWPARNPEIKVVGGLNFRRGAPFDPCAFIEGEDGKFYPPYTWERGLVRVDVIGTGSICIAREVFEAIDKAYDEGVIDKPYFWNDYSKYKNDEHPGEDMGFCSHLRQLGIKMWVDTTVTSPHIIDTTVQEDTYRQYLELHNAGAITYEGGKAQIKNGVPTNGANPIKSSKPKNLPKKGAKSVAKIPA